MLLTLNQVISQITTLAAAHSQIAASGVGDFAEWQAEERNYPLLWVFHETTNVGNRELIYSIRLICADRVITGEEGEDTDGMEQEVLSDTLLILLDFLAYFQQQHSQTYTVVPSATIDPFTERFNDRVAGNSMVIQIRQPFTWDACQIPQTGATIPPSVDGLTLYDFCDQAVIDRLTPTQIACLEAEYALPCAPVTQQVNGTTIGTTPSGGTNNQLIRNTAGTAVGTAANPSVIANTTIRNSAAPTWTDSVVAGVTKTLAQGKALDSDGATTLLANYIPAADGFMFTCTPPPPCADATVTINGASLGATGTIPSGGSEDLDVLQGGVATGSWNGSAWIIPTCPSSLSLSIGLSTSTPNYASSLTITATPTGITPTSYTFFITNTAGESFIVTQASNVYAYTVLIAGTLTVSVIATDGTSDVGADAQFTCDNLSTVTKAAEFIYAHNNATGLTMASVQRSAITTLVNNLNGSGTTNSSQFLARMVAQGSKFYPYCPVDNSTANANAYKMCLINPLVNLTFTNFVAGDFTANGLTGGATKQASTGVAMNAYLAQRTGFHAYCRTNSATAGLQAIGNGGGGNLEFWLRDSGQCYIKINSATYTNAAVADSLALFSSSVKIGTSAQIYKRGVLVTTGAAASAAPSSADIKLHSGGGVNYETRQFAGFCIGFTPETTNEWADWYQLWQTYQTNVITGGRHV